MPRERIYGDGQSAADLLLDWTKLTGDPQITGGNGAVFVTVTRKINEDADISVRLDRKGINRLVEKLRRARDQAFGRDE